MSIEKSFLFAFGSLVKLSRRHIDEMAKPLGLTRNEWLVLAFLKHHADPVTQTEIKNYIGIDNSNLTKLLRKLEDERWLVKKSGIVDKRNKLIALSGKRKRDLAALFEIFDDLDGLLQKAIPAKERKQFIGHLKTLKAVLDELEVEEDA